MKKPRRLLKNYQILELLNCNKKLWTGSKYYTYKLFVKMTDKKRMQDKERILRYLLRNGSVQNTFKISRELGIKREEILLILNELAKEGKAKLMHGSVRAVTKELRQQEIIKTKSEVEELKERVEKLEKAIIEIQKEV